MRSKTLFGYIFLCGVFLFLDRLLKWSATLGPLVKTHLLNPYFGWEPFFNKGIAFGIPVARPLVFVLTIFIIGSVLYFYYQNEKSPGAGGGAGLRTGLALVLAGAISNLVDRIIYGHTIDYVRIFTGVINLADVFIVTGFILYFSSLKRS